MCVNPTRAPKAARISADSLIALRLTRLIASRDGRPHPPGQGPCHRIFRKAYDSLGANQHRRVPHNVVKMIVGRLSYAHRAYRFRQLFYFHGSQPAPAARHYE